jgi:hypothetical protein
MIMATIMDTERVPAAEILARGAWRQHVGEPDLITIPALLRVGTVPLAAGPSQPSVVFRIYWR